MEGLFHLLSQTGDGACAIDGQQRIVFWNESAELLLGHTRDEVRGRFCYEVLCGTDRDGTRLCRKDCATCRLARRSQALVARDLMIAKKGGGKTWVNMTTLGVPLEYRDVTLLIHLFRDARNELGTDASGTSMPVSGRRSATEGAAARHRPAAETATGLTPREREVLLLLTTGASTESIAGRLFISVATVRNHVRNILAKLEVHSRVGAVTRALRDRLV